MAVTTGPHAPRVRTKSRSIVPHLCHGGTEYLVARHPPYKASGQPVSDTRKEVSRRVPGVRKGTTHECHNTLGSHCLDLLGDHTGYPLDLIDPRRRADMLVWV